MVKRAAKQRQGRGREGGRESARTEKGEEERGRGEEHFFYNFRAPLTISLPTSRYFCWLSHPHSPPLLPPPPIRGLITAVPLATYHVPVASFLLPFFFFFDSRTPAVLLIVPRACLPGRWICLCCRRCRVCFSLQAAAAAACVLLLLLHSCSLSPGAPPLIVSRSTLRSGRVSAYGKAGQGQRKKKPLPFVFSFAASALLAGRFFVSGQRAALFRRGATRWRLSSILLAALSSPGWANRSPSAARWERGERGA